MNEVRGPTVCLAQELVTGDALGIDRRDRTMRTGRFIPSLLALAASAAILGLGVRPVRAETIGVAINRVADFQFSFSSGSGLFAISGAESDTAASFNGAGPVPSIVTCPLACDGPQSTAGPGPFPLGNTFTQPPPGLVGSRGDSQVISTDPNGPNGGQAAVVGQSHLTTPGAGTGQGLTEIHYVLTVGQTSAMTFSFVADPFQEAAKGPAGDFASAVLVTQVNLALCSTTACTTPGAIIFGFAPDGTANNTFGLVSETDPFSLNSVLNAQPGLDTVVNHASATFGGTSVSLAPGTYALDFFSNAVVRTNQAQAAVPEASALVLLASGLTGLGIAGWKCRRPRPSHDTRGAR
jgi:hypothetical protein